MYLVDLSRSSRQTKLLLTGVFEYQKVVDLTLFPTERLSPKLGQNFFLASYK